MDLSARETEIVRRVYNGERHKTIAAELGISVQTVKVHITNARAKLGVPKGLPLTAWELARRNQTMLAEAAKRFEPRPLEPALKLSRPAL